MSLKNFGRFATVLVALGAIGSTVRADEIVHFTNGAEMTVRSHVVVGDMLKLDLGGNNFISFPISMVGKIVNAGQDVFLNPVYFPSNQAVPAVASAPVAQSVGGGPPVGLVRQALPGRNGARLGEATDIIQANDRYGSGAASVAGNGRDEFTTPERPRFDPLRPLSAGGVATIDPPKGGAQGRRAAPQMSPRTHAVPVSPIAPVGGEEASPGASNGDSGEGGQDNRGGETANPEDPAPQDPPPNR